MECSLIRRILAGSVLAAAPLTAIAQTPVPQAAPPPITTSRVPVVSVLLRERANATQWFSALPNAEQYGHGDSLLRIAIAQRVRRFDYTLEMGNSSELLLPTDAVSPVAAQGQLGLGGTYYAANGNNNLPAAVSFRQGFLRWHSAGERARVRAGRFEFFDGQETTPKDSTVLWLQTNRMAQRLIGNFGFSNGQRSLDGIDAKLSGTNWDLTAMGARAVQGVFKMAGNEEMNVDVQYVAYSRYVAQQHVLLRGFGIAYHDGRTGVLKTDNRPMAVRAADHRNIRIGTYGGSMIASLPLRTVTGDLLVWGVGQSGAWGAQDHKAGAVAVEGGLRADAVPTHPWLRGGFLRTTGDNNPNDGTHNTFFQVLTTPRNYARFPYFNMMNSSEQFVQLIDRPHKQVELRTDLHFLQLTAPSDMWYQSGGPYDNKSFGYVGRSSNGHGPFSTLYDASLDYAINKQLGLTAYYAHVFGKSVIKAIYPVQPDANYGYFELQYKLSKPLGR